MPIFGNFTFNLIEFMCVCVKPTYIKLQAIKLCENGQTWPGSDLKIVMCYKVPTAMHFSSQ